MEVDEWDGEDEQGEGEDQAAAIGAQAIPYALGDFTVGEGFVFFVLAQYRLPYACFGVRDGFWGA